MADLEPLTIPKHLIEKIREQGEVINYLEREIRRMELAGLPTAKESRVRLNDLIKQRDGILAIYG